MLFDLNALEHEFKAASFMLPTPPPILPDKVGLVRPALGMVGGCGFIRGKKPLQCLIFRLLFCCRLLLLLID